MRYTVYCDWVSVHVHAIRFNLNNRMSPSGTGADPIVRLLNCEVKSIVLPNECRSTMRRAFPSVSSTTRVAKTMSSTTT